MIFSLRMSLNIVLTSLYVASLSLRRLTFFGKLLTYFEPMGNGGGEGGGEMRGEGHSPLRPSLSLVAEGRAREGYGIRVDCVEERSLNLPGFDDRRRGNG